LVGYYPFLKLIRKATAEVGTPERPHCHSRIGPALLGASGLSQTPMRQDCPCAVRPRPFRPGSNCDV
jgi:hypothetical protein